MDTPTGYRTGSSWRPSPAIPHGQPFELLLPASVAHRREAEQAARLGISATTEESVAGLSADNPYRGNVAILARDERDAKQGKTLVYGHDMDGDRPLMVVGAGELHWEQLQEMALRELETPAEPLPERRSILDAWSDYRDMRKRASAGQKTYGAFQTTRR